MLVLETKIDVMLTKQDEVVNSYAQVVQKHTPNMNNVPTTPTHVTYQAVTKPHQREAVQILDEITDRERRKNNLIIHSILEFTSPDSAKCNQDDRYKVHDLIKEGSRFYDTDESRFVKQMSPGGRGLL